jgi:hypothetical protein
MRLLAIRGHDGCLLQLHREARRVVKKKELDQTSELHERMLERLIILPSDYTAYGGKVERWADDNRHYPDCSSGCRHFAPLAGQLGNDWGVCANTSAPRFGLLTFEHQAGYKCFEQDDEKPDWMQGPEWSESKDGVP